MAPLRTADELEDQDVGELLALIDELYASQSSGSDAGRRGRRREALMRQRAHAQQLRDHVAELERSLDALRRNTDPHDATDRAQLWARVAIRQRGQRETAVRENALLRHAVQHQLELARRMGAIIDRIHARLQHLKPITETPAYALPSSAIPTLFSSRLDAAYTRAASCWVEMTDCYSPDHYVQWNETKSALFHRFRTKTLYPFKLSSVATEVWRRIQEQTSAHSLARDQSYSASDLIQLRAPFGYVDVRGPSALRRVCTQDGGVLMACVSILKGPESKGNLVAGLEMHDTMWVRVVRTDACNPRSPVVVETVTESVIFAPVRMESEESGRSRSQLERLRQFMERYYPSLDLYEGRQKLENRLLEASLSISH